MTNIIPVSKLTVLKIGIILISITVIYLQDFTIIFGKALNFDAGNIGNYILVLPFLAAFVIYQKRNVLVSKYSLTDFVIGIAICITAITIFFGSDIYTLEYHIVSFVVFSAGATILLFGITVFRKIFFAFVLLSFLVPIPIELVNSLMYNLNPITAVLVKESLIILGNNVTFGFGNTPELIVELQNDITHVFQIGQPSSGIYSMVVLSSVGLFIAYITSGKIWKRGLIWAIGFPVIFLLNAFRIVLFIFLWYHFGEDAAESFHAVSGSLMIGLGVLTLLLIGDRIGVRVDSGKPLRISKSDTVHDTLKQSQLKGSKGHFLRISSLVVIVSILLFSQVHSSGVSSQVQIDSSGVALDLIDVSDAQSLLPVIENWDLEYSHRDSKLEQILQHDLVAIFKYVGETKSEIYAGVDIGSYIHRPESSLTLPGREQSTILSQEDIAISDKTGRFLAYKTSDSEKTVVILYWVKEIPLDGLEKKYVELIVTSNTDYLAANGFINGKTDYEGTKDLLLFFAIPIDDHWSNDVTLGTNDGELVLLSYGKPGPNLDDDAVITAYDGLNARELIRKADESRLVDYNFIKALDLYKMAISRDPDDLNALNGIGQSLVKLNQNVEAIEYFDQVLSIDENNPDARIGIGDALYNMKKPDEAIYHYTQALLQSDGIIGAMVGMAAVTFDLERYGESMLWVEKILSLDPDNPSAISIQINLQSKNITTSDVNLTTTKLSGIAYSTYRAGQLPITGPHPSVDDIDNDIQFLSSITDKIRIYGLDGNNQFIPEIAKKHGVKVAVTLMLTGDETDQDRIERGTSLANQYPETIYTMIVENEKLYRETMDEEQIINYIVQIRKGLNPECTITIAEPSFVWLQHPKIAQHVDYVMIHYYPYWGGFEIDESVSSVFDAYYEVRDTFGKDVVIGETGWPSDGRSIIQAVPGAENQEKFVREFREIADERNIEYFFFEAFDEKWKLEEEFDSGGPNDAENHWGLFYENGILKESLGNVVPPSQHDTTRK